MNDLDPDEYGTRGRSSRYDDIRDDYDDEFGVDRTPLGRARRKVVGPAIAFMVIGGIGILGMGVAAAALLLVQLNRRRPPPSYEIAVALGFLALAAALFAVVLVSGVHLRRLRRRWLALTGAYIVTSLALAGPYGVPFFPFGIWALVVLYQPDVCEQFRRPPGPVAAESDR
jgi:hypothetical protein